MLSVGYRHLDHNSSLYTYTPVISHYTLSSIHVIQSDICILQPQGSVNISLFGVPTVTNANCLLWFWKECFSFRNICLYTFFHIGTATYLESNH